MRKRGISKRRYFSFFGILLSVALSKLGQLASSIRAKNKCPLLRALIGSEDDPPSSKIACLKTIEFASGVSSVVFLPSSKAQHCNCVFRRKTCLALFLSKIKPTKQCRCRHRKTGLAPPR